MRTEEGNRRPAPPAREAAAAGQTAGCRRGQGRQEINAPGPPTIVLPARRVPVLDEADILVCGGGPAGIATACCAARQGARVVLLERWPSVGGMATNALVNIWHTSDRTRQVIFGLVEEIIQRGGRFVTRRPDFPARPETHDFDPAGLRVVLHRLLLEAGVRVYCNLQAVEPVLDGDRLRGALVDTKTGRQAVLGQIVVDATGDGDVAAAAGAAFELGRPSDGRVQGMTLMFCLRGVDEAAVKVASAAGESERVYRLMVELRDRGEFPPFNEFAARHYLRTGRNHVPYNMCPAAGNPLDERELTELSHRTREQVYAYLDLWRREMPGFERAEVEQMGFGLGIRESRRIAGRRTLTGEMVVGAVKQPDAVGHGFWMIDIHDPRGSGYTTWSDQSPAIMPPVGESYHIPLGMCLNPTFPNLAVVGRCASATHEACASVRLQSHCLVMGQGLGTAAALALDAGVELAAVDLPRLQATLRAEGVFLEDVPDLATGSPPSKPGPGGDT